MLPTICGTNKSADISMHVPSPVFNIEGLCMARHTVRVRLEVGVLEEAWAARPRPVACVERMHPTYL